jgi:hypothetical protein
MDPAAALPSRALGEGQVRLWRHPEGRRMSLAGGRGQPAARRKPNATAVLQPRAA